MRCISITKSARYILLSSAVALLLTVSVMAPVFAASTKVTNTKMIKVSQDWSECGSIEGDAVDFWYCWVQPGDETQDYQYDYWEKHHDVACWTHMTGWAQGGSGPAYSGNLNVESGPPTPECP